MIADDKPHYGEVPGLVVIRAAGKTLEEYQRILAGVTSGCPVIGVKRALTIPPDRNQPAQELKRRYITCLACTDHLDLTGKQL